jgi:hypothetical protein
MERSLLHLYTTESHITNLQQFQEQKECYVVLNSVTTPCIYRGMETSTFNTNINCNFSISHNLSLHKELSLSHNNLLYARWRTVTLANCHDKTCVQFINTPHSCEHLNFKLSWRCESVYDRHVTSHQPELTHVQ